MARNTDIEFKPCPFCGGTDIRCDNHGKVSHDPMHRDDNVWSMCCYNCGATFPNRYNKALLVEAWNTRVEP
jgi:Lar family restriction alleviation protein